jgi:hypothetical protein
MTHRYFAYGLGLRSNAALGGMLPPCEGAPELTLDVATGAIATPTGMVAVHQFGAEALWQDSDGGWLLRYDHPWTAGEGWTLSIRGEQLVVRATENVPLQDVAAVLQGPGLAAVLHHRGVPLLHASAIDVGGRAILVMGEAGAKNSRS